MPSIDDQQQRYLGSDEVILITGGSGCLAQHLIRELQTEWAHAIKEIRVLDKKIFKKFLDYPDNVPIVECIADCAEVSEISPFFDQVTIVFHTAARPYHFGVYPNKKLFWRDNFIATQSVISAMIERNVPWLVHTSDVMACMADEDSQGMNELSIKDGPENGPSLLGPYGESKCQAQGYVRKSNGRALKNGGILRTIVLMPTVLYGEGDNWFLPHVINLCRQYGYLLRFGNGQSILSMTYAGNCAHAHLAALCKLRSSPEELGGECFTINENKAAENFYDFLQPFLLEFGYSTSNLHISFLTGWFLMFVLEHLFYAFYALFGLKFDHNLPNSKVARILGGYYFHFNTMKARTVLDYLPKYDVTEARRATLLWWKRNYKSYW